MVGICASWGSSFARCIPKYRCRIPYCESQLNATYSNSDGTLPTFVLQGIRDDYLKLGCEYLEPENRELREDESIGDAYLKAIMDTLKARNKSCANNVESEKE